MLAYYVLWHMMEVWRPLVFSDEEQQAKAERDPVAPAQRSDAALRKIHTKKLDDGRPASSFRTLLRLLSNIVRNKCRRPEAGPDEPTFDVTTTPDSKQQRAYDLLKVSPCRQKPAPLIPSILLDQHRILVFQQGTSV